MVDAPFVDIRQRLDELVSGGRTVRRQRIEVAEQALETLVASDREDTPG